MEKRNNASASGKPSANDSSKDALSASQFLEVDVKAELDRNFSIQTGVHVQALTFNKSEGGENMSHGAIEASSEDEELDLVGGPVGSVSKSVVLASQIYGLSGHGGAFFPGQVYTDDSIPELDDIYPYDFDACKVSVLR